MAEEPERPIENLLRKCGKQRLPAERIDLHPANRRLLQAEVANLYGQKTPKRPGFSLRILPKLAWSFAAFTVVAVATMLILSNSNRVAPESRLARNDKAAVSSPSQSLAQQTGSSQETEVKPTATADRSFALLDTNREPTAQFAPPTDAPALIAMNSVPNEPAKDVAAKNESAAIPVPVGASAGTPVSRSNRYLYRLASTANAPSRESFSATTVQKFVRDASAQAKEKSTLPVLGSFQYEQAGSEVRIIDQDGSVYTGTVTAAPIANIPQLARFASPRVTDGLQAPKSPSLQNSAGFVFHVSGTNLTLQQLIVFDGQWLTQTNIVGLRQLTNAMIGGVNSPSAMTMPPISGSLKVGEGQGVLIKAIPAGP